MTLKEYTTTDLANCLVYVVADEPCIRPLDMFMSEVDRVKYPDVKQKYRFERVKDV